jgi:hypothetical protein
MTNNQTENRMNSPEDAAGRLALPFFARFLEGARAEHAPTTTNMTLKYPSDRDEIDPDFGPTHPA